MSRCAPVAAVVGACVLAAPAHAECELSLNDFGAAMSTLREAIAVGQNDAAAETVRTLHANVRCLQFEPPPKMWAEWLFLVAELRYTDEEREASYFESPLRTARRLYPEVGRARNADHHLFGHDLPYDDSRPVKVDNPRGYRVIVDGMTSDDGTYPGSGMHLVQINNGAWWDSAIVEAGEAAPDLFVPRYQPAGVVVDVELYGQVGGGFFDWQSLPFATEPGADPEDPPRDDVMALGGGARVAIRWRQLAVRADVDWSAASLSDHVAIGAQSGRLGAGAGVARTSTATRLPLGLPDQGEPSATDRRPELTYAEPTVLLWVDRDTPRGVAAELALTPSQGSARVAFYPQRADDPWARYWVGLRGGGRWMYLYAWGDKHKAIDAPFRQFGVVGAVEIGVVLREGVIGRGDAGGASR